jgi:hypothetical protein
MPLLTSGVAPCWEPSLQLRCAVLRRFFFIARAFVVGLRQTSKDQSIDSLYAQSCLVTKGRSDRGSARAHKAYLPLSHEQTKRCEPLPKFRTNWCRAPRTTASTRPGLSPRPSPVRPQPPTSRWPHTSGKSSRYLNSVSLLGLFRPCDCRRRRSPARCASCTSRRCGERSEAVQRQNSSSGDDK